jgi:hypothetical protein
MQNKEDDEGCNTTKLQLSSAPVFFIAAVIYDLKLSSCTRHTLSDVACDVDYRLKTEKESGEWRSETCAVRNVLDPSLKKNTRFPPPNMETFNQGMHLKIPLLGRSLRLSNSKARCRVSALHLFLKWIPPTAFWHWAHSDKCFSRFRESFIF